MRALEPRLYDIEVQRLEAGAETPFQPVDPLIDRDIADIRIAETLNVPAPLVRSLPLHWVGSALVLLESRNVIEEERAKKRKRRR